MILEKAAGGNREQSGKAKLSCNDKVQEVSSILGNQSVLQMEKLSVGAAGVALQRWERDAGNYSNITLHGIGTGIPPEVSKSQYVGTTGEGQNFVLGWDSMVVFTEQAGAFQIGYVWDANQADPDFSGSGQTVEAVVTRGVASCTAVLASNGRDFALLHLDEGKLPWGLDQLRNLNDQWQDGITDIFISYTDDRKDQMAQGRAYTFARESVKAAVGGVNLLLLERGVLNQSNAIHSEIGLGYAPDGQMEVFGDMIAPYKSVWRDFAVTLGELNTDPNAADFNRCLFNRPYPNPNVTPPVEWSNIPAQPPQPGWFERFVNWVSGLFQR